MRHNKYIDMNLAYSKPVFFLVIGSNSTVQVLANIRERPLYFVTD